MEGRVAAGGGDVVGKEEVLENSELGNVKVIRSGVPLVVDPFNHRYSRW